MTRVIVHAGFHKTGTSSLQDHLRKHREALAPYAAIYLKEDFLEAGNAGRIYGLKRFPWRLRRFRLAVRSFLEDIPDGEVIFLSWEGFSGVMPGHRRMGGRSVEDMTTAGIPLAKTIIRELRKRFGSEAEITFLYTTRARESWIKSVYGHVLRSIQITDDFETFRAGLPKLPHLEDEADRIAAAIAPVPVIASALEEVKEHPQGPAIAALELMGVPQNVIDALPPATRTNAGNTAVLQAEFLRLNREMTDKDALKAVKDKLARRKR